MNQRCGFVAIGGAPNAGKSTFLNRIVGAKVSIVSHKVQTTRAQVRGLVTKDQSQIIFVDTPGIFTPKRSLDKAMVGAAWDSLAEADLRLLLIDAAACDEVMIKSSAGKRSVRSVEDMDAILDELRNQNLSAILVLNKIDRVKRENLLGIIAHLSERLQFDETFLISATTGDGVDDVISYLADHVPAGPWLYPEDQLTDLPLRLMAAEITREKLILRLHDELPYASTVETESWTERKNGDVRIEQVIYVERDTQKAIVLGKGGQTIKEIGQLAREEIRDLVGSNVHLFLQVKTKAKWMRDPERYSAIGLKMPKD